MSNQNYEKDYPYVSELKARAAKKLGCVGCQYVDDGEFPVCAGEPNIIEHGGDITFFCQKESQWHPIENFVKKRDGKQRLPISTNELKQLLAQGAELRRAFRAQYDPSRAHIEDGSIYN